jgi:hypothetical protein
VENLKMAAQVNFFGATLRTDWLPREIEKDEKGFVRPGSELAHSPDWTLKRQPFLRDEQAGRVRRRRCALGLRQARRFRCRGRLDVGPVRAWFLKTM